MTEENFKKASNLLDEIHKLKSVAKEKNLFIWNGTYTDSYGWKSYTNNEINNCLHDLIECELAKKEEEFASL